MKTENNIIGKLEAMLFASGEPVEAARLAEVLELDVENITKMLSHLADTYDEKNSGIQLIRETVNISSARARRMPMMCVNCSKLKRTLRFRRRRLRCWR